MPEILMLALPAVIAIGSAIVCYFMMQARMESAVAREKEDLTEARALLRKQEEIAGEMIRSAEAAARRDAFDQFLAELRVEERRFVRQDESFWASRKTLVCQERLFFRNLPLSDWVSHEVVMDERNDISNLARACSVFAPPPSKRSQLLGEHKHS